MFINGLLRVPIKTLRVPLKINEQECGAVETRFAVTALARETALAVRGEANGLSLRDDRLPKLIVHARARERAQGSLWSRPLGLLAHFSPGGVRFMLASAIRSHQ